MPQPASTNAKATIVPNAGRRGRPLSCRPAATAAYSRPVSEKNTVVASYSLVELVACRVT